MPPRRIEGPSGNKTAEPQKAIARPERADLQVRESGDFRNRPDFDCSDARSRNPGSDFKSLVEIMGIDQKVTADLFPCLRERSVRHEPFSVANLNAGALRRWMQRCRAEVLPARIESVR